MVTTITKKKTVDNSPAARAIAAREAYGASQKGGAGGAGIVIVTEYY